MKTKTLPLRTRSVNAAESSSSQRNSWGNHNVSRLEVRAARPVFISSPAPRAMRPRTQAPA